MSPWPEVVAKHGIESITKPSIFGDEHPHAIGWLRECRHALPETPGMVYLGNRIGDEVVLIKLAEDSIRAMINGFLDDPR